MGILKNALRVFGLLPEANNFVRRVPSPQARENTRTPAPPTTVYSGVAFPFGVKLVAHSISPSAPP